MTEVQCSCGQFKMEIQNFPNETPGRLGCYCDDCQSYLVHINRIEWMDSSGCTEVIPIYPKNLKIISGQNYLQCLRLKPNGVYRWFVSCCGSPIGNTRALTPWFGLFAVLFHQKDPQFLEKNLGEVKSRIMGKFARGKTAPRTALKMDFRALVTVFPFMLKGKILKRFLDSPFFEKDGTTPVVPPKVLTKEERLELRKKFEELPRLLTS